MTRTRAPGHAFTSAARVSAALTLALVAALAAALATVACHGASGHRAQGDRARPRWPRLRPHAPDDRERRLPGFAKLAASGGFAPLGTSIPPQSPGGLVELHHRPRPRRARHLRLHPSRSEDDDAVSVHDTDRGRVAHRRRSGAGSCRCRAARWSCCARASRSGSCSRRRACRPPSSACRRTFRRPATATRELSGMGTPDILGTYGTFGLYTSEPFAFAGQTLSGGVVHQVKARRRRGARHARRARQPVPARAGESAGRVHRASGPGQPAREDCRGIRGAAAGGRRVERLDSGELSAGADAVAERRSPVLPQGARSVLRDVRQPGEHRPVRAGDAGVHAGLVCGRTGRGHRPLLHAGHARGHQGAEDRRADRCRVPHPGPDRRRREPAAVPLRAGSLHRRPALLLLRQRRPGLAHDVARARPAASCLRRRQGRPEPGASSKSSIAASTS